MKRGRPKGVGVEPPKFKDRFQKFYYVHRKRLNKERGKAYKAKRALGLCVRCTKKALPNRCMCRLHRDEARSRL